MVSSYPEQDAHQLVGQAKRRATKIWPTAVEGGIFDRFAHFDKCRPAGGIWWRHIRCGCRLGHHGCPCNIWWVWVKQWQNYLTLWTARSVLRSTFVQYLISFCSRPEVTSDKSFLLAFPTVWNNFPLDIRSDTNYSTFCTETKTFLFRQAFVQTTPSPAPRIRSPSDWSMLRYTKFIFTLHYIASRQISGANCLLQPCEIWWFLNP